jgi:hypothetical protein
MQLYNLEGGRRGKRHNLLENVFNVACGSFIFISLFFTENGKFAKQTRE